MLAFVSNAVSPLTQDRWRRRAVRASGGSSTMKAAVAPQQAPVELGVVMFVLSGFVALFARAT